MAGVQLSWYLILSAVLFTLRVAGFLLRRNVITVFMSIELMLNAVNLTFITFSYQLKQVNGHIFSFFVMVVAAAEAAVGLAIILTVFKMLGLESLDKLKEAARERLTAEFAGATRQRVKRMLLDRLDETHRFEAPPSLVEEEFNLMWNSIKAEMESGGKTFADEDTTEEGAREEYH